MQVVGRPCEICTKPIKSELDGVGCATCQRFFHDACVLSPPKTTTERPETYRDAAAVPVPAKPKKKRKKVRCPGCGADVRAELREHDRVQTYYREVSEERRRVAALGGANGGISSFRMLRFAIGISLLFVSVALRVCAH